MEESAVQGEGHRSLRPVVGSCSGLNDCPCLKGAEGVRYRPIVKSGDGCDEEGEADFHLTATISTCARSRHPRRGAPCQQPVHRVLGPWFGRLSFDPRPLTHATHTTEAAAHGRVTNSRAPSQHDAVHDVLTVDEEPGKCVRTPASHRQPHTDARARTRREQQRSDSSSRNKYIWHARAERSGARSGARRNHNQPPFENSSVQFSSVDPSFAP